MTLKKYNIHEAKTHLSRLIEQAVNGEPFLIAKAGQPLVKVIALDTSTDKKIQRSGFMKGQFSVPSDFNHMGSQEISDLFGGEE
jgi:prevent-host-death family protein